MICTNKILGKPFREVKKAFYIKLSLQVLLTIVLVLCMVSLNMILPVKSATTPDVVLVLLIGFSWVLFYHGVSFKRFLIYTDMKNSKLEPQELRGCCISKMDLSRYLRDMLEDRHINLDDLLEKARIPLSRLQKLEYSDYVSYTSCFLYELDSLKELEKFIKFSESFVDSEKQVISIFYVQKGADRVEIISVEVLDFD